MDKLTSSEKRVYLAQIANKLGYGGQKIVCESFGIAPKTLSKGLQELESGIFIIDAFDQRGRHPVENFFPTILEDIKSIVDCESQIDPRFEDNRLFTRLTPEEIRLQLHKGKGYALDKLPSVKTIYNKVKDLGYCFTKVQKVKPLKKVTLLDKKDINNCLLVTCCVLL